jgi:alkanesulfonate monooxygenase SsuD/methylene tetrahydromethanopterin reductase-like flavin-dependent oxidoreductase (luciferase family)
LRDAFEAMRALWAGPQAEFHGEFGEKVVRVANV